MGPDGDRGSAPRVPRMKVLHLLRDGAETTASRIIAVHAKEHQVTVIDLSAREISYEDLVDEIFAHDKVICW
ncbi:MAG: hypothetical protein HY083_07900 [Gammaproteobacteria bacterium]|nr:hypothetical protein [Gammaproteobacteria bacterium]